MSQSDPNKKFADESSKKLLKRAYSLSTSDDARKLYRDWAKTYDHHLETGLKYQGPKKIATLFAHAMTDRSSPVLDIGCGTGLVADHLTVESFTNIVGLDFSPEMLAEADQKNVYRSLIEADLEEKLLIADASYAGAISCGTFTHGHVGPSWKIDRASKTSVANFGFFIGATSGNLRSLNDAQPACGIKIFMGSSTGDLLVDDEKHLDQIFGNGSRLIAVH
ncbi:methyltransferase domain-containing protein, partial [Gammaproteobacteria bacterium]|nr:methyltransferase domain-containing protein [Gammaproteobacteria bacterium]